MKNAVLAGALGVAVGLLLWEVAGRPIADSIRKGLSKTAG